MAAHPELLSVTFHGVPPGQTDTYTMFAGSYPDRIGNADDISNRHGNIAEGCRPDCAISSHSSSFSTESLARYNSRSPGSLRAQPLLSIPPFLPLTQRLRFKWPMPTTQRLQVAPIASPTATKAQPGSLFRQPSGLR
jgi:hypothetical protein